MKIEIDLTKYLDVRAVTERLYTELEQASVIGRCTYGEIEKARMHLYRAQGMYMNLAQMELISDKFAEEVAEDITRIESKLDDIQRVKSQEAVARRMKRKG